MCNWLLMYSLCCIGSKFYIGRLIIKYSAAYGKIARYFLRESKN